MIKLEELGKNIRSEGFIETELILEPKLWILEQGSKLGGWTKQHAIGSRTPGEARPGKYLENR